MHRFSLCTLLLLFVATPCLADDEGNRPESFKDTAIAVCGDDGAKLQGCKDGSYIRLTRAVDAAFKTALAKAQPAAGVLFKRDQVWFGEVVETFSQNVADEPEQLKKIAATLQRRLAQLDEIKQGLGRGSVAGRWVNAFGTVEVTPAPDGPYRIVMASEAIYGSEANQQQSCKASALVRPGADGWLSGDADAPADAKAGDSDKPARIKVRLQGQTLRAVAGDELHRRGRGGLGCDSINQLTGSYFPAGKSGTGGAAPFVVPTFDCARPGTASEEEICADPELAANDARLNRAWKELLPRLDATTRRLLTEDQRGWVKAQGQRYLSELHPPMAKQSYFVHWTGVARDNLAQIQRERIALLEGFDEKRRGFEGEWRAYNAQLSVTRDNDGGIHVDGNKWFEDDYKGGCDYDFSGKADGDVFRPKDTSKNPDSIERDHASLIVNRTDDAAAKRRFKPDGTLDSEADEAKCKRRLDISSTARLFPVRPSHDVGDKR